MSDNGKNRPIRAGHAFMKAVKADPQAQHALADSLKGLRKFAEAVEAVGVR
jgi:hypothetical protein